MYDIHGWALIHSVYPRRAFISL